MNQIFATGKFNFDIALLYNGNSSISIESIRHIEDMIVSRIKIKCMTACTLTKLEESDKNLRQCSCKTDRYRVQIQHLETLLWSTVRRHTH
ncbi:uncharacterized protein PHALS_00317 [Plasmopara halstedii]|uniref:Uncharacterized protein n=1 Tax=Plasmopara halstedii TaxID=4781 RepID=A0A0N7L3I8_PLAHL|nr:uncharacterized protein PHALS_00317 [Plasmopara halstedii]CEG35995.1 hypothetical protein PHALS_00317 [Plasmopara halstedii]|eukprot:XP_024572364.1 hypothetical protein PHALS_00317 [Plasmopara halstedii]